MNDSEKPFQLIFSQNMISFIKYLIASPQVSEDFNYTLMTKTILQFFGEAQERISGTLLHFTFDHFSDGITLNAENVGREKCRSHKKLRNLRVIFFARFFVIHLYATFNVRDFF